MKAKTTFSMTLLSKTLLLLIIIVIMGIIGCDGDDDSSEDWAFTLTVLHNNDSESELLAQDDFGGVAQFATLVELLKNEALAQSDNSGVVMFSSGDNFLAGPEFGASLDKGVPFFDTIALDLIGYDAFTMGNHDFDFGPDVLADFIEGFTPPVPFLSANLDFSQEPRLQSLVEEGRIASSVIKEESGELIGIIGATTPELPFISSPGDVVVNDDVADAVQAEVDRLEAMGVNIIILISHLESVEVDLGLIPLLNDVDIAVVGDGDGHELLADPEGDLLIPGDEEQVFGPYPILAEDADGQTVPVITTSRELQICRSAYG